jgi:hypothetical protein
VAIFKGSKKAQIQDAIVFNLQGGPKSVESVVFDVALSLDVRISRVEAELTELLSEGRVLITEGSLSDPYTN